MAAASKHSYGVRKFAIVKSLLVLFLRHSAKSSIDQEDRLATSAVFDSCEVFPCAKSTLLSLNRKRWAHLVFEQQLSLIGKIFHPTPTAMRTYLTRSLN